MGGFPTYCRFKHGQVVKNAVFLIIIFCVFSLGENVTVKEILLELASKINVNQRSRFNINRSAVWEGGIRGFKRLSYEPSLMMSVKFSDDMGKSEGEVDLGCPRREFLRLLMESIAKSPCLREQNTAKTLLSTVPVWISLSLFVLTDYFFLA